jgi:hypothetical protein
LARVAAEDQDSIILEDSDAPERFEPASPAYGSFGKSPRIYTGGHDRLAVVDPIVLALSSGAQTRISAAVDDELLATPPPHLPSNLPLGLPTNGHTTDS